MNTGSVLLVSSLLLLQGGGQPAKTWPEPSLKPPLVVLGGAQWRPSGSVNTLAFSPDGTLLASGGSDQAVQLWDVATGNEVRTLRGFDRPISSVVFSADGRTLLTASWNSIHFWELLTGKKRLHFAKYLPMAHPFAFSADQCWFASASQQRPGDCVIRIWNAQTEKLVHELEGHQGPVRSLAFSADGKILASGSDDATVRLWELAGGKQWKKLAGHDKRVAQVAFAPDGKTLASYGVEGKLRLWRLPDARNFALSQISAMAIAFSPDGKLLAVGGHGVAFVDPNTGQVIRRTKDQHDFIKALAFSADGKSLAAAGWEGPIQLWDPITGNELRPGQGHQLRLAHVFWMPGGSSLVTSAADNSVRVWDLPLAKETRRMEVFAQWGKAVALSPDGKLLAAPTKRDNAVLIFDSMTGKELAKIRSFEGAKRSGRVAFAPDGKLLAACFDERVRFFELPSFKERQKGYRAEGGVVNMRFSPDSDLLAIQRGLDRKIYVCEVKRSQVVSTLDSPRSSPEILEFSPDGRTLVTGEHHEAVLWEVISGQMRIRLTSGKQQLMAATFSPDGRLLAVGGFDNPIRVWDWPAGRSLLEIKHPGAVMDLAWHCDGAKLASASANATAMVWDVSNLSTRKLPKLPDLPPTELEIVWKHLSGPPATPAYWAAHKLLFRPRQAIDLLGTRLPRVKAPERATLARLVTALQSEDFSERERATAELIKMGALAESALKQQLHEKLPLEAHQRVRDVLDRLKDARTRITKVIPTPAPEHLLVFRAVQIAEHLRTPAAIKLLQEWASGAPSALLTQEASSALNRLKQHRIGP